MQYLSQNKSADFAEGLFWELCYQHENKRFKIYLDLNFKENYFMEEDGKPAPHVLQEHSKHKEKN